MEVCINTPAILKECWVSVNSLLASNRCLWRRVWSEATCHFHARAIAKRRKARFPLRMCRILFAAKHKASQTQLDGIAHEQTIICRQLFAGHVVGSRPIKREKNLLRMIICHIEPSYWTVDRGNLSLRASSPIWASEASLGPDNLRASEPCEACELCEACEPSENINF